MWMDEFLNFYNRISLQGIFLVKKGWVRLLLINYLPSITSSYNSSLFLMRHSLLRIVNFMENPLFEHYKADVVFAPVSTLFSSITISINRKCSFSEWALILSFLIYRKPIVRNLSMINRKILYLNSWYNELHHRVTKSSHPISKIWMEVSCLSDHFWKKLEC